MGLEKYYAYFKALLRLLLLLDNYSYCKSILKTNS